jgi:serine/threonine-protein kinase
MKLCPKCQKQFSDDANFCPVDAARLTPLATGSPAAAAGSDGLTARFELGDKLGGSRTGDVRKATDKQTGKPCVVKLVAPAVVALPGVAQRLERELKQLERVQSAGVAKVIASGKRGDETWVAIEALDGAQTLAEAISARGPIAVDEAAHLIEVIGEALIEAAQVGVVHRDLAPKNVLFAGADVKLINFSLPVPTTDKVPGVPEFVAPEQVDGKLVDQRSNLYSLGALYYYVLTGQTVQGGAGGIKPVGQLAAVPPAVETVIMRALDKSPTKRFLTVRQFVDEVGRIARSGGEDDRATMPLGKANNNRGKVDLVQTLLGVKGGGVPAIAASPPPSSGVATMVGVASGATPAPASAPVAAPAAAAGDRSPWAAPGGKPDNRCRRATGHRRGSAGTGSRRARRARRREDHAGRRRGTRRAGRARRRPAGRGQEEAGRRRRKQGQVPRDDVVQEGRAR